MSNLDEYGVYISLANREAVFSENQERLAQGDVQISIGFGNLSDLPFEAYPDTHPTQILGALIQTFPVGAIQVNDISSTTIGGRPAVIANSTDGAVGVIVVGILYNQELYMFGGATTPLGEQSQAEGILLAIAETITYALPPRSRDGQSGINTFVSRDCLFEFSYPTKLEVREDNTIVQSDEGYAAYLSNTDSTLATIEHVPAREAHLLVTIQPTDSAGTDPEVFLRQRFPRITQVTRGSIETRVAVSSVVQQEGSERLYIAYTYDSEWMALIEVIAAPGEVDHWGAAAGIIASSLEIRDQETNTESIQFCQP
jgi:hypothetical protein